MDVAKLSDESFIFLGDMAIFVVEDEFIGNERFDNVCS